MNHWRTSWSNFRGFARPQVFEFPRFTVLIGRNNVGKTSAYAPLLLLRQTLDAQNPDTALLTRGRLMDVGTFEDVVHNHDSTREMVFQLDFASDFVSVERSKFDLGRLEVTFGSDSDGSPRLNRSRVMSADGKPLVTRVREADPRYFNVTSTLIPSRQAVGRPLREITELRAGMRSEKPNGFFFSGLEALRIPANWRQSEERWQKARVWFNAAYDIQDLYQITNWSITRLLKSVSYLGPLRSLPLRTYRLSPERPSDVGRDGEHAPELLFRSEAGPVVDIVNEWLGKLGYGSLDFEDRGDDFFQMYLKHEGGKNNLRVNVAHSGVGLSQLLPILVQGALTAPGTTFIAQQPEIHLNPAQQCLVTDFLIESTDSYRRVIVETHSEHILLRLRRRVAEGEIAASDVAIYYFDHRDGRTTVERIPLGEEAEITRDRWPRGFFEEQLSDSLALARAQSRS